MALYDSSQMINIINNANAYLSSFYPSFNSMGGPNYSALFNQVSSSSTSSSGSTFSSNGQFGVTYSSNPFGAFNDVSFLKARQPIAFNSTANLNLSSNSSSSLHSQRVSYLHSNDNNSSTRYGLGFGNNIVSTARKYLGYNEANGSYKLFTDGRTEAWCADFVTHCVDETCEKTGRAKPSGFGSPSVSVLRNWGIQNDCYLRTDNKSNKKSLIAQNVKPGDVVIFKNGMSHTGIVERVNADGSFTTIEGNTSDKVARRNYSATDSRVSGFVQLA